MASAPRGGPSLRGHGSRGSFAPNQNRRGGPAGHAFGGGSFRAGRSQHQGPSRPRHDPAQSSPFARKDENRRTLTDFKILGFEIPDLAWSWGVLHPPDEPPVQHPLPAPPHIPAPPPSRIRIYFHTPVTPDDARPIPHNPSLPLATAPSDSRKGKRKKLEDDDPDDEHRARPPPPQMRPADDRSQSEDWLMAAIVEGEDAEAEDEERLDVEDAHTANTLGIHADVHMWTPERASTEPEGPSVQGEPESVAEHAPVEHAVAERAVAECVVADNAPVERVVADNASVEHAPVDHTQAEPPAPPTVSAAAADDSIASSLISSVGEHDGDTDADHVALPGTQVPHPSCVVGAINELLSAAEDPAPPPANGVDTEHEHEHEREHEETQTQIDELDAAATQEMDHLPEPPASPVTTLGSPTVSVHKPEPTKAGRVSSANRLSISYAGGNRRLVVDAEVVESLKLFRQEGRIEVLLNIVKDGDDGLKGILVEGLSDVTKSYLPLQAICDDYESDDTLPPFSKAPIPSAITLRVYLDTARPLSEPKWAKSGDVQEWLKSMFGRMFWVAGDAASGWEKKIHVVDPDPPPTIWTILDGWAANSPAGVLTERQRFLKTHMGEADNVLEILLRLVRGERATASYQAGPALSAPSVSGPLLAALAHGSAHGAQQTHVSLAVLALFRMAVEYAAKAGGEGGRREVEERMGEIVRCLPSHLVYKSLDGIFKEWRVEKKGR